MNAQVDTTATITSIGSIGSPGQTSQDGALALGASQSTSGSSASSASATTSSTPTVTSTPSAQDLQTSLQQVNAQLAESQREVQLQVDAQTGLTVATVRNSSTGAVLQQYPAQHTLRLAQMLASWSHGGNALLDLIA